MFSVWNSRSPYSTPIVPITPVLRPAASSIDRSMNAVVVFPFVPVMPIIVRSRAGWPKNSALSSASASRVFSVRMTGAAASTGSSARIAAAPFSAAIAA